MLYTCIFLLALFLYSCYFYFMDVAKKNRLLFELMKDVLDFLVANDVLLNVRSKPVPILGKKLRNDIY